MGSSKNNNRSISDRSQTLLDRLHQALNLGTWHGGKWQCIDIQIQKQVVRSVLVFFDSVAKDELSNPIVKDLIASVVKALVTILESKNVTVLDVAVNASLKLITVLPDSIMQSYVLDLVGSLSLLLPYHQTEVLISCAKALHFILSKPTLLKNEKGIWNILKRTQTVCHAISNVTLFFGGTIQMELFQSMASLLSAVLRRWPLSRFPVYSDAALMTMLSDILGKPDSCGKVEVLRLLSSIALCGNGAEKLLENGEFLLRSIVQCMDSSQPHSVRIEGFTLARRLAMNEERFSKMLSLCREPLIRAIISGMRKQGMDLRKVSSEQMSLMRKAFRLALITRWGGEHHLLFWKQGISIVLLDLLKIDFPQNHLSFEEQILMQRDLYKPDNLLALRYYAWDILGWLAIHCEEGFNPEEPGNKLSIDLLISYTCSNFVKATHKLKVYSNEIFRKEFPIRAFFMMIYSPCKYIASEARSVLSELHARQGKDILKSFMTYLGDIQSGSNFSRQDEIIYVMALACYIGSPEFGNWVLEFKGLKVLIALVRRCLSNPVNTESLTVSDSSRKRTCCYVSSEGWEGKDLLMLYSLWGLAELIKHLKCLKNDLEIASRRMKYNVPELVEVLKDICFIMSGPGLRWFASYALSSLGLYGFPSTLGERVGKAISETCHADIRLILKNGEHLNTHSVILAIRCPSLLQHGNKTSHSAMTSSIETNWELQREIRLSGRVDQQALQKILDFLYIGYLQAGEEDTKLLKALATSCNLQPLLQMLRRERPKWGTPFPEFDLCRARDLVEFQCSDFILEVEPNEQQIWPCYFCTSSVTHFHVHKVVLASKSRYMWGLLYSGFRESFSRSVKLDLSSEAMVKLVAWFYTDELPSPASGCLWEYMSDEKKLQEVEPYVELSWLFDYWALEDNKKTCLQMVVSRLESAPQLLIKVIKVAVCFDVQELVEVATNLAAPLYRQFHDSGELEDLDDDIVHKVRSASVQHSLGNL